MADPRPRTSGRIFISYRREETSYPAGWLFDRLVEHYGDGQVFKDVDSIEPGDDFVEVLRSAVGSCEVLLALIGKEWVTVTDVQGRRRLDSPDDFVRLEIEAALERDIRVIPILVDGAAMPRSEQLPSSLAKLERRHALELSPSRFDYDLQRLVRVLDRSRGLDRLAGARRGRGADGRMGSSPDAPVHMHATREDADPVVDPAPAQPSVPAEHPPSSPELPDAGPVPPVDVEPGGDGRRWLLVTGIGVAVVAVAALSLLVWSQSGVENPKPPVTPDSAATITDAGSKRQITTIDAGPGSSGVAVGPRDVWVSNYGDGSVYRLDPASGQVLTRIPVGKAGGDIVACPDAVWVISDTSFVARIDVASKRVTDRFQIGAQVVDLAVRCGESVWVSAVDGRISGIRHGAARAELLLSVAGGIVADVDVDPQGVLWMSHKSGNAVLRVDPRNKIVQRIAVDEEPIGIAAAQVDAVWVTSSGRNTVTRIDPTSNKVVKTFPVGKRPWGVAVGPDAVWSTNLESSSVSRIDPETGQVTEIAVGSRPDGIAVGHGAVWVANGESQTISRIS